MNAFAAALESGMSSFISTALTWMATLVSSSVSGMSAALAAIIPMLTALGGSATSFLNGAFQMVLAAAASIGNGALLSLQGAIAMLLAACTSGLSWSSTILGVGGSDVLLSVDELTVQFGAAAESETVSSMNKVALFSLASCSSGGGRGVR